MKHFFKLLAFILILGGAGLSLTSCEDDKIKYDPTEEEDGKSVVQANIAYTYQRPSYIGNVSEKMREVMNICVPNQSGSLDASTGLLLLGNLNEIPFSALEEAYKGGATIAVENPRTSDFATFFEAHPDWAGYTKGTNLDGKLLFSFDNDGSLYMIDYTEPIDFDKIPYDEEPDETVEEINDLDGSDIEETMPEIEYVPEYYTYVSSWLRFLNNDDINDSASDDPKADPRKSLNKDFKNFADNIQVTGSAEFSLDPRFRHYSGKRYFKIKNAKVTVSYGLSIYPIHVYEGEKSSSPGNYFVVEATATVDSHKAFKTDPKGALCQTKSGTHCHHAGYYSKDATIRFQLVDKNGKPVAAIVPNAGVLPDNENAETTYSNTKEFSVDGSVSVSGGINKDKEKKLAGEAKLSLGWKWTNSVTFSQKDVTIVKNGENINDGTVGWKLAFFNTPKFDTSCFRWVNINKNPNSQNCQDFMSGWIWYDKNGTDESEKEYYIRVYIEGNNEVGSFYTSRADWKTKTRKYMYTDKKTNKVTDYYDVINETVIPIETRIVGAVELTNKQRGYISDIKLWKVDDPDNPVYYNPQSIEAGKTVNLGAYFHNHRNKDNKLVQNKYVLSFAITNKDGSIDVYEYRHFNTGTLATETSFILEEKGTRKLYTDANFKKVATYKP